MLTLWDPAARVKAGPLSRASAVLCVMTVLVATVSPGSARSQVPDAILGDRSPALERLFTPVGAPRDLYQVFERRLEIAQLAAILRAADPRPAEGAWELQRTGPGDAFGGEGLYDRARLAMLVGGGKITVARGSLKAADGSVTAYTLLSPYPEPELTELRTGTMTIVVRVPAPRP
jgi:hypothetical protein